MLKKGIYILTTFIVLMTLSIRSYATHAMGMDLTYECVSEDVYLFRLSFYRDCDGVNAPNSVNVDFESISCGENFTVNFSKVSFQELNAVCPSLQTTCGSGTYPGVEEHIYEATVTLPAKCTDWSASTGVCCRNNAINTIVDPGNQDIFVTTNINNVVGCNNSPVFAVNPVPFMCATKSYCFNNGAADLDGDSLVYSLVNPTTGIGAADTVEYVAGYNSANPITSNPAFTFNSATGDFCMTPTVLGEVSVMQVLIEEYRDGVKIGSVERDIQLRVINCPNDNNLPYVNGIDGSGDFEATICAGEQFSFTTTSVDADATNTVTMNWNQGIADASFNISGGTRPVGTFTWTPDENDIRTNPYCFTVEVVDDNCPFLGSQVFSFCLTVVGVTSSVTSTQNLLCADECTGTATAVGNGGVQPYSYLWDNGQNSATATNLCAGGHSVTVTDDIGCSWISSTTLTEPITLTAGISSYSDVLCAGMSSGFAVAQGSGGMAPYSYQWSTGDNTMTAANLPVGSYTVTVTDNNNCNADTTINISEPTPGLSASSTATDALCKSGNSGTAQVTGSGGTSGYTYEWNILSVVQTTQTVTGLSTGTYQYTVTDVNGCKFMGSQFVGEPATVLSLGSSSAAANCFGSSDGSVTINVSGGNSPYSYLWDSNAGNQTTPSVNGLPTGNYMVSVTDANLCEKTINVAIGQPIQLELDVNATNTSCGLSNGSASVAPSGGTVPYTILWQNGETDFTISGQPSGFYTLTVTDNNGCEKDTFAIMNDLTPASSVFSTTDLTCYGVNTGEALLEVNGGLSPYAYQWTDGQSTIGATGLAAGVHFVTVLDANSCKSIHAIILSQPPQIVITTDSTEVLCFGGTDGLGTAIASPAGGVSGYTFLWDGAASNQTTSTATGLSVGVYTLTVTDGNGCVRDTTFEITQPADLILDTAFIDVACYGESTGQAIVLPFGGITPYSYLWDINTGSQTGSTATGLIANTYAVTVTDNNNCVKDTVVLIGEPAILDSDTAHTDVICYGASNGSVQVDVFGGISPYTYLWSNGSTVYNVQNIPSGVYRVTATDVNGCQKSTSVFVAQPTKLAVNITSTDVACYGDYTGQASATVFGGITPYTYYWSNGQNTSSAGFMEAGYTYLTITDANNCRLVDSVFIDQPDTSIYVSYLTLDVSCFGGNDGAVNLNVKGGTIPYSFVWSTGTNNNLTNLNNIPEGNYGVTITDLNGCTYQNQNFNISQPDDIMLLTDSVRIDCFGDSTGQASVAVVGGSPPYSYLWEDGQTTTIITGQFAGTYDVTVIDEKLCSEDTTVQITQPTLLVLQQTANTQALCTGDANGSAQIQASGGTTSYTYQWGIDAAFQAGQLATALKAGTYTATVTDGNGCTEDIMITITEPDTIKLTTTPQIDTICPGENAILGALATGGNGGFTYNWDNGFVGAPQTVNPDTSTIYGIWIEDDEGCLSEVSFVTVNMINFQFDSLLLSYDEDICIGFSTIVHSSYYEDYPPYTYQWSNGLGSVLGDISVSPTETTTYYLTVTDQCNKKLTDSITVEVFQLPEVNINFSADSGCQPLTVSFYNELDTSNIVSYEWDFGDGFSSSLDNPSHVFAEQGTFEVTLQATTDDGCENDRLISGVEVTVNPKPIAEIKLTPQITKINDAEITFISLSTGANYFDWDFGDGDSAAVPSIAHTYLDTGTYIVTLIVENEFDCTDTTQDIVIITPSYTFDVPDAFVPNTNGPNGGAYNKDNLTNDVFIPITDYVLNFHLEIFNRWGELIYESFDINKGWDGYYRGEICQQDVYVWKANVEYIDGTNAVKVGEILLIR